MATEPREIHFEGIHCNLTLQEFAPGVVAIRIAGSDVGEFGSAPVSALDEWLAAGGRTQLFIDAREGRGVSIDVSAEWAQWLSRRKADLQSVTMLTGSPFIQITADFVRRIAALEGIMRICTEPEVFDRALADAVRAQ